VDGRKIGEDPEDRIVSALEAAETTLGGIERAMDGIKAALSQPLWVRGRIYIAGFSGEAASDLCARGRLDPASEIMIERIDALETERDAAREELRELGKRAKEWLRPGEKSERCIPVAILRDLAKHVEGV